TVAALALEQAAATNPQDNVVGQLTLLDSPEDNQADISDLNPVDDDGANFDWFYLSQLKIARTLVQSGTTTIGQNIVEGVNTTNLSVGMGVAGSGIPSDTTIVSIGAGQVTLSASATASGSTAITFSPPPGAIFVDSYVSYFGAPFNNFVVN